MGPYFFLLKYRLLMNSEGTADIVLLHLLRSSTGSGGQFQSNSHTGKLSLKKERGRHECSKGNCFEEEDYYR